MNGNITRIVPALLVILFLAAGNAAAQAPEGELQAGAALGSGFTYQGRLARSGGPVTGTCDFSFGLYDQPGSGSPPSGGTLLGTDSAPGVGVSQGYFTVVLNEAGEFGPNAFTGQARYLQVTVNCGGGAVVLSPRQPLTASPYALYAQRGPYTAGTGLTLTGAQFSLSPAYRLPQACGNSQVAKWNAAGGTWVCADDSVGSGTGGDITAVYAGAGLTGGGASGDVSLAASFAGSGSASSAARSDHTHWGQGWSGSGTGLTLSGGAYGLNSSGSTYGVVGQSFATTGGIGLLGSSLATTGYGTGVNGESLSTSGRGVVGLVAASSGETYGVYGESRSSSGAGVVGRTTSASGTTLGVWGQSDSQTGRGVYGMATHGSGVNHGVWGQSSSTSGTGVYGAAPASSGNTYGVYGQSSSTAGTGVRGNAVASSGNTYGVYGQSGSPTGTGVMGSVVAVSGQTCGVYGQSSSSEGRGVYGAATSSSGVTYGVVGDSSSATGYGGYFRNNASNGGVALYAVTLNGSGPVIEAWSSYTDREFFVRRDGYVYADGPFSGSGADYAELLPGAAGLEPGQVLVIGPDGRLAPSSEPYQASVAGVYSTQPGFVAGEDGEHPAGRVPLAVMGVAPVKATAANGPIRPGDLLASSAVPGHAMAAGANPPVGTVIGKALEPLAAGEGLIKMLATLQ